MLKSMNFVLYATVRTVGMGVKLSSLGWNRDFLRDNAKYLMTDKRERVGKRRWWGGKDDCGFPAEWLYHLPE